mmetsp:Transcript_13823/g.43248  ORF Transcript_13823/g.43248 Transcript_13823/m.43248 type:complete len:243 (+) Transcript_13823:90-818(+)
MRPRTRPFCSCPSTSSTLTTAPAGRLATTALVRSLPALTGMSLSSTRNVPGEAMASIPAAVSAVCLAALSASRCTAFWALLFMASIRASVAALSWSSFGLRRPPGALGSSRLSRGFARSCRCLRASSRSASPRRLPLVRFCGWPSATIAASTPALCVAPSTAVRLAATSAKCLATLCLAGSSASRLSSAGRCPSSSASCWTSASCFSAASSSSSSGISSTTSHSSAFSKACRCAAASACHMS